jgi:hypothetical protein
MDPRGGVLAVGANGAGKTTFLRLLPLFYGATAQQILRGTGRSKMIAYTLPDASSAVAFEYERESEDDLRLVVMHCRPNEDAPQFHIVRSGFRETYFFDENRQFVPRDEFKARVEAMRFGENNVELVEVTQKLFLHQYRSVILNERLATKEGKDMRRLAAKHSLGPTALVNLDQIAAAVAGGFCAQLKIMKAKPQAEAMAARAETVKGHHISLCSLHVAVKAALAQVQRELTDVTVQERRLQEDFEQENQKQQGELAAARIERDNPRPIWPRSRKKWSAPRRSRKASTPWAPQRWRRNTIWKTS